MSKIVCSPVQFTSPSFFRYFIFVVNDAILFNRENIIFKRFMALFLNFNVNIICQELLTDYL